MLHAPVITAAPLGAVPTIALGRLAPWLLFAGLLASLTVFFVTGADGAVTFPGSVVLHELVHDGRHLLGLPCH